MHAPQQRTLAEEYFAAIRAMDVERWVDTFDTNAVSHDPVGAPRCMVAKLFASF